MLIAAILFLPAQQRPARAQGVNTPLTICIVITVVALTGYIIVRSCKPTYRCWSDPDNPGTNWCSTMSANAGKSSGFVWSSINFRSYEACMKLCSTNTASTPQDSTQTDLVVYKSTDLVTWTRAGTLQDTDDGNLEFTEPATARTCFYFVREEAPVPALKR